MSKDANGPTNGGSKFKVVGGTVIADEKHIKYHQKNQCLFLYQRMKMII